MSVAATAAPAFDPRRLDLEGFAAELKALRREVAAEAGEADLEHLKKIERWGHAASLLGAATAGIAPNPISALLLALGRSTRWLLMHHVGHKAYDKIPGVPPRLTSKHFARGNRRFLDWPDWMRADAWCHEHNVLHHGFTGEDRDPDLIERNAEWLRGVDLPRPVKLAVVGLLGASWRPVYYAPRTLRVFLDRDRPEGSDGTSGHDFELWTQCYLPYATLHFALFPLAYLPFGGPWASFSAFWNSVFAEILCNLHTFAVVGPNHTGEDLHRFGDRPRSRAEGLLRQVLGSVNYACGDDATDWAHLFLNYQIEHHLWPDLTMLQYQRVQPRVRALCEKYGIPYVQESVLERVRKMVAVAIGDATMKRSSSADLSPEAVMR